MENASRALLMAAGVLISMVIASMLMLMANSLTEYQQNATEETRQAQVLQFNEQYEGYNRKGVRGNELYSLVNKVIDYNLRKSDVSDLGDGSALGSSTDRFQAMEITFDLKKQNKELTRAGTEGSNKIFKSMEPYVFNDSKSTLRNIETMQIIDDLKNTEIQQWSNNKDIKDNKIIKLSDSSLDRLVTGYDKIFVTDQIFNDSDLKTKIQYFYNFNSALGVNNFYEIKFKNDGSLAMKSDFTIIRPMLKQIQPYVDTYYEYVYFKRAIFDCTNVVYNTNTGRIIKMDFEFTGKFN